MKIRKKAGLYSLAALIKKKERIKDGFQNKKKSERIFVIVAEKNRPDFLLKSLKLLHKGLQLIRAFRLILFSPDVDYSKMRQAEKKQNRIGQKNPYTIMYVFFNKDSKIDVAILASAGHFQKIIDRVLNIKADELDDKEVIIGK